MSKDAVEETSSQESGTSDLAADVKELAVEDKQNEKEKEEKPKRKRGRPSGADSPAKRPKELTKSISMSSIKSTTSTGRPRGRPRRSLLSGSSTGGPRTSGIMTPVTTSYKMETQPRGKLLAFGMGDAGQLGLGEDVMERKRPQPVKEIEDAVISAAAGGMHNVFITEKGEVFTFGCNDEGALGRKTDDEDQCFAATKVDLADSGVFCCAGDSHTAILTEEGTVWLWGTFRDANGRLGMQSGSNKQGEGEKAVLNKPTKLDIPTKILRMASGADHLLLLDTIGQVYSLGCAENGQLGRLSSHFCQKGGRRGAEKVLQAATIQLKKICRKKGNIVDVACGQYSSFLVTEHGAVVGFGLNNCYQMGFPDREARYAPEIISITENDDSSSETGNEIKIKKVVSGMHHSLFLSDKGDVYSVGCGDYGRLGVGQKDKIRESQKFLKVKLEKPAVSIGIGSCTSYAIFEDGTAMAWGMGSNLQLTNGSEDDEWEPVQMSGKNIEKKQIIKVSGGGQHAIILCKD